MSNKPSLKIQDMISILLEELQKIENITQEQQKSNETLQGIVKTLHHYQPKLDTTNLKLLIEDHKKAMQENQTKITTFLANNLKQETNLKQGDNSDESKKSKEFIIFYAFYIQIILLLLVSFFLYKSYQITKDTNQNLIELESKLTIKK